VATMFPPSSHPDTVLSGIKDQIYIEQIAEYLEESLRDVIGARRTEILKPEVVLGARGLYYGFTVGAGHQTMGQEYCDINLVGTGGQGQPILLKGARRALYTLLEVVWPYLWHRVIKGPGWSELRRLRRGMGMARQHSLPQVRQPSLADVGSSTDLPTAPGRPTSPSLGQIFFSRLKKFLPQSKLKVLLWLSRLHLALFFLNARYYTWAMRFCRVRLLRISQADRPRPSYAIMGVFLFIQVIIEALQATKNGVIAMLGTSTGDQATEEKVKQDIVNIKVPSQPSNRNDSEDQEQQHTEERCVLCMTQRLHTSATPCGHLFCWECILGWCATNPECPICRQPAEPQSIIVVQHYAK